MPFICSFSSQSLPGNLILAIIAAGVGSGFQHGYNTGVTNAPTDLILQFINETHSKRDPSGTLSSETVNLIFSTIVSVFAIGGMIGALLCGFVADRIGRKAGLIYNNILVFIAAACMGFSKSLDSYELLIVGRFVIGFNSGLNAGLGPMYLSEISPVHFRGAIGTIYQLIITISILASNVLGSSSLLGTDQLWPILLASTLFGSVVMLLLLPFCPESPNFLLIIQGKDVQAQKGECCLSITQFAVVALLHHMISMATTVLMLIYSFRLFSLMSCVNLIYSPLFSPPLASWQLRCSSRNGGHEAPG